MLCATCWCGPVAWVASTYRWTNFVNVSGHVKSQYGRTINPSSSDFETSCIHAYQVLVSRGTQTTERSGRHVRTTGIQTSRAVPRALPSHFIASVLIRERALWRALPKISRMRSGFVFGNGNESRQTEWDRIVHESGLRSMYPTLPAAAIRALSGDWNAW